MLKTESAKRKEVLRLEMVFSRLLELVGQDIEFARDFASELDMILQSFADSDMFGTEGQNDPRGDMRNGEWWMGHVEGVD